jgi:hypothetical protein
MRAAVAGCTTLNNKLLLTPGTTTAALAVKHGPADYGVLCGFLKSAAAVVAAELYLTLHTQASAPATRSCKVTTHAAVTRVLILLPNIHKLHHSTYHTAVFLQCRCSNNSHNCVVCFHCYVLNSQHGAKLLLPA